jgi:hypothetical protein
MPLGMSSERAARDPAPGREPSAGHADAESGPGDRPIAQDDLPGRTPDEDLQARIDELNGIAWNLPGSREPFALPDRDWPARRRRTYRAHEL